MASNPAPTEHLADLDLQPNEASGLLRVDNADLLQRYGWDRAFWTVLDAVDAAECVALIGHDRGGAEQDGWTIERLHGTRIGSTGDADDAEALARHGRWVYVFGSHHGGKEGPIRRREQWIARFDEQAINIDDEGPAVAVEVVDTAFGLHRIVNDALQSSGIEILPMEPATRHAFIETTLEDLDGTPEQGRVRPEDWTINIEGADFTAEGRLLLGLRYPVAAGGQPLVVQLDGCAGLFEQPHRWPTVDRIWVLDAIGADGEMAGVRDLCVAGDEVHVVTGDLDSAGKGSVIREDHPGGRSTVSTHFKLRLDGSDPLVLAELVRQFPDHPRIEGIAADLQGDFFYVSDEDETVRLTRTPLIGG